jgi:hypothetical protein
MPTTLAQWTTLAKRRKRMLSSPMPTLLSTCTQAVRSQAITLVVVPTENGSPGSLGWMDSQDSVWSPNLPSPMLIPDPVLAGPSVRAMALASVWHPVPWDAMTPLISLRDCGAPYRGKWVVYNTGNKDYCAMHHLKQPSDHAAETIEERIFEGDYQTSRFVRHLLLHGWSIYEITDAIAASKVI